MHQQPGRTANTFGCCILGTVRWVAVDPAQFYCHCSALYIYCTLVPASMLLLLLLRLGDDDDNSISFVSPPRPPLSCTTTTLLPVVVVVVVLVWPSSSISVAATVPLAPHYLHRAVVVFYSPADRNCDYAVCLRLHPSVCLSVSVCACMRACSCVCMYVCVCLSVCLSVPGVLKIFAHVPLRHHSARTFALTETRRNSSSSIDLRHFN